ncbi:hypothetical protein CsSME_00051061 [Camellia sinensis var. sinensis]
MLVLEGLVCAKISAFSPVGFMLLLVLLVVCLTCCGDNHFALFTSKCLSWMKLMKCCHEVFKNQIYDIFQLLPPKIQVGVFSATMPPEALEITRKFMNKPGKRKSSC